jgi:hypothetical protein
MIMAAYMFQLSLPAFTDEMTSTIPVHREYVEQLFTDGRLLSYSVSQMRDNIWCVISAEDEAEAVGYVADFPLFSFFTNVQCYPLLLHNTQPDTLPGISMN